MGPLFVLAFWSILGLGYMAAAAIALRIARGRFAPWKTLAVVVAGGAGGVLAYFLTFVIPLTGTTLVSTETVVAFLLGFPVSAVLGGLAALRFYERRNAVAKP